MFITALFFTSFMAFPLTKSIVSLSAAKAEFYRIMFVGGIAGVFFGYRNSYYRLQGLVPNGLELRDNSTKLVKYNYTQGFVS